jgi:hypothetical protein
MSRLTNCADPETGIVPITDPTVGWLAEVTALSDHEPVTCDTWTVPAVPRVFTNSKRLTFEIEVTLVPAGRVDRLNLMKVRVVPAFAVAPTWSNGAEPKLVDTNAVLTCASSLGEIVCPKTAAGITSPMQTTARRSLEK